MATLSYFNTLRPRQDGRHFPDDIFKSIFFNGNCCIWIQISLKYVPKGPINNSPALVQKMAWRRSGDKPLSEPMMVRLPTHICVTRPQWVNNGNPHTWKHGLYIETASCVQTFCVRLACAWWRPQMETFSVLLAICAGNSPVPGEFHAQRPVTRSVDAFFDLRLN